MHKFEPGLLTGICVKAGYPAEIQDPQYGADGQNREGVF